MSFATTATAGSIATYASSLRSGAHGPSDARRPRRELIAVLAGKGDVVEPGTALVERLVVRFPVGVQAEELAAADREHRVVEIAALLVLVEDGLRSE